MRLGLLRELVPEDQVCQAAALVPDRVNGKGEKISGWRARVFTPVSGIYFVLALCLFSRLEMGYERVARWIFTGREAVSSAAISRMRRRLGEAPLRGLFVLLRGALARSYDPGCHFRGLLITAQDGTTVDMPDTVENRRIFSRNSEGGYPQVRIVALIECGTRAMINAVIGTLEQGEREPAYRLCAFLAAGTINLADRGFFSWHLWQTAAATGAELLWRVASNISFPIVQELGDGSHLSVAGLPGDRNRYLKDVRAGKPPRRGASSSVVRVVCFSIEIADEHGDTRVEEYRLVTTLLDHRRHPAKALAKLYARRWASETAYFDLKTTLRGADMVLRSGTPEMVRQEIWAFLVVYQAIRILSTKAAQQQRIAPERISFSRTLDEIQLSVVNVSDSAAPAIAIWRAAAEAITRRLAPVRPFRSHPRCRKIPKSPHPTPRKAPPKTISYTIHSREKRLSPAVMYRPAS